jgi:N-methylhydantoinase A/oxoprolinase/acetone carboxylase beta subunit
MFNFLKKKKREPENLAEIFSYFEKLENNFEELSKELEKLKKESKFSLQKIGILRYNPFSDVGSNQSFSIAVLDGRDDGLVITSLYAREGNRIYGKPIKEGNSEYSLSKEEKEAIKIAQNKNKNGDKNKRKLNNPAAGSGGYGPR